MLLANIGTMHHDGLHRDRWLITKRTHALADLQCSQSLLVTASLLADVHASGVEVPCWLAVVHMVGYRFIASYLHNLGIFLLSTILKLVYD